ncbi:cysteine dioxygenase [Shewanella psychrotolerans]|uniref:cysteine dioxygenase family protein n=1 Tax=Shewanella psychrotolerans TaxID=2864206 RepID=UPI001C65BD58|nr:cysteine dioxygenase [Shewanella psychrotolerans]QYK01204.1 cysteine dioxygenase [Shewanella psychrotolerans]
MENSARLREFIQSFTHLIEQADNYEERIFVEGKNLLSELIRHDDWLPEEFAKPSVERYQQYLLYCDPLERFSVVSFVWAPGQTTPVHDHTVWGMVGVMRGAELCEEYQLCAEHQRDSATAGLRAIGSHHLPTGSVDLVSPRIGDIHKVSNALKDRVSISIHVYGANIGAVKRYVYDLHSGQIKPFISGYSSKVIPNIWDCSTAQASTY